MDYLQLKRIADSIVVSHQHCDGGPQCNHCMDLRDAIAAAIMRASSGWQPIETAPKAGTRVDLWIPATSDFHAHRVTHCQWHPMADGWIAYSENLGISDEIEDAPTHWMPIPEPPK